MILTIYLLQAKYQLQSVCLLVLPQVYIQVPNLGAHEQQRHSSVLVWYDMTVLSSSS